MELEEDILDKLSRGNKAAFKCVFDAYYKSICLFAQRYVVDAVQAEDIAQEVFIGLFRKKGRFASFLTLKAYMYETAKNLSLNSIKHEAVKKRYQEAANQDPICENLFSQNYIKQEVSRLIMGTIDQLPPRQKSILRMAVGGYRNQEIADQLDLSIHTVKNHKAAAYRHLKHHLKNLIF